MLRWASWSANLRETILLGGGCLIAAGVSTFAGRESLSLGFLVAASGIGLGGMTQAWRTKRMELERRSGSTPRPSADDHGRLD